MAERRTAEERVDEFERPAEECTGSWGVVLRNHAILVAKAYAAQEVAAERAKLLGSHFTLGAAPLLSQPTDADNRARRMDAWARRCEKKLFGEMVDHDRESFTDIADDAWAYAAHMEAARDRALAEAEIRRADAVAVSAPEKEVFRG